MVQSFNFEEHMTEDAMIEASTSLMDILGMNASRIFQVVGQEIEGLNLGLGSYDNIAEEIVELAREQKERNENDGKDAAIAVMEEIQERELERISRIPPQFDLTAEEWENVAENLKDPEVRQAVTDHLTRNGATDAEAQQTILYMEALARISAAEDAGVQPSPSDVALAERYENDPAMKTRVSDTLSLIKEPGANNLTAPSSPLPAETTTIEERVNELALEGSSEDDVVAYQAFQEAGSPQQAFTMAAEGNMPEDTPDLEMPEERLAVAANPNFEFGLG
ncbi:MAG: hypothetical protein CMH25_06035 [Micavibrio sp.]|nr:hypothetical protein [Micavibrio sp.]